MKKERIQELVNLIFPVYCKAKKPMLFISTLEEITTSSERNFLVSNLIILNKGGILHFGKNCDIYIAAYEEAQGINYNITIEGFQT